MKPIVVDVPVSEQDAVMGAIWSKQCMNPYKDAVLIGDDILLLSEDGEVLSGIHISTITSFGAEA